MSFRPTQDKLSKRVSRTIDTFNGCHYGISKEKQPNEFGAICDLRIQEKKPVLRDGKRKNETLGYLASITSMFPISLSGEQWLGSVIDGVLQVQPLADVLTADRRYYTWHETKGWTIDELMTAKTWNDLLTTRNK